jgi:hypothetical protein
VAGLAKVGNNSLYLVLTALWPTIY